MYTVVEDNELAQPEIIFSNPSSFDITIQVMITDITAVGVNSTDCTIFSGDNDYTMGIYNVSFSANVTLQLIDIPICNDVVLEDDESFGILIINSFPDNVISGILDQATVTILDNDCE